jgi:predicted dithiol-disulfide oxidoreductase (DUF899 family)
MANQRFGSRELERQEKGEKPMADHLATKRHPTASAEEWQAARDELLAQEKEHTRRGDELARKRRELPWLPVEKDYRLDTDEGQRTLTELFDGRSQLLVYHFMFGPSYEAGDPVNSSIVDGLDGLVPHLHARDLTLMLVSRAPLAKLQAYKRRMGWSIPWASSANSDFNFDLGASSTEEQIRQMPGIAGREVNLAEALEGLPPIAHQNAAAVGTDVLSYICEAPVVSAFALKHGAVYQTYTTTWRGLEFIMGYYPILDRAPKGRDEGEDDWQTWLRRHDEYGQS